MKAELNPTHQLNLAKFRVSTPNTENATLKTSTEICWRRILHTKYFIINLAWHLVHTLEKLFWALLHWF